MYDKTGNMPIRYMAMLMAGIASGVIVAWLSTALLSTGDQKHDVVPVVRSSY